MPISPSLTRDRPGKGEGTNLSNIHRLRKIRFRPRIRWVCLGGLTVLLILLSIIPVRLAIAHYQAPQPQAIFTLGGGPDREQFTAQFAKLHPSLAIWISSGSGPKHTNRVFQAAGISPARVTVDCRAIDTVTNFTSMVTEFKRRHIQHLYLITSADHMPRATAIATVILGSQGIAFTPIASPVQLPNNHHPESWPYTLRDSFRAMGWVLTGRTGASLNPNPPTPCG